jgi:hypothetical protein
MGTTNEVCCVGMLVCRYLFRRCDNEAAPWSAADTGDGPWEEDDLPEEAVAEIASCTEAVYYAGADPAWGYDMKKRRWGWLRDAPVTTAGGKKTSSMAGGSVADELAKEVRTV